MFLEQPPSRRGPGAGTWLGCLLAVVAFAVVGTWLVHDLTGKTLLPLPWLEHGVSAAASSAPAEAPPGREPSVDTPKAERPSAPAQAAVDPNRGDTILTCEAVDGSVFYTNATRCELADLENRVNVVPADESALAASGPAAGQCLGAQPGGDRVHGFLAACMEPFNEALRLEPFLLESDDPAESRTGRRYCELITEGVQAGCMATSDQFCFLPICQEIREAGAQ